MIHKKVAHTRLTHIWLQCKAGCVLLICALVCFMALEWLGGLARDAYCTANDYVDGVNRYLFGDRVSDGLNGVQDFFGLGCPGATPPPTPTPGYQPPVCNGDVTTFFDLTLTGARNEPAAEKNFGGVITGAPFVQDPVGTLLPVRFNDGTSGTFQLSLSGSDVNHIVNNIRVVPSPGVTCQPPGGNTPDRPPPPPPIQTPPIRTTPPPPAVQVPITVNFNFGSPISIPGIVPIVIPVVANITPEFTFAPTFNIPFTLELPDLNANFDFAFNPAFNLFNIEGVPINFPPESVPPGEVLDGCPEVELPPPQYKIEERIIGAYVYWPAGNPVRGKTRVFRGSSEFNESIYPRFGHVQFILSDIFNLRVASQPVTERFGFVACPYPYGATAAQWSPEPGFEGASVFAVRKPVAIPVKEDGTSPTGLASMVVLQ